MTDLLRADPEHGDSLAGRRDPIPLPQWFGELVIWAAPVLQRSLYVCFGIVCTWQGPSWALIAGAVVIAIIALEALTTRKERAQ